MNRKSPMFEQAENVASRMWPRAFRWAGSAARLTIYADDDPFWKDLANSQAAARSTGSWRRTSAGCRSRCGSSRPAACGWPPSSAGLRAFVEQTVAGADPLGIAHVQGPAVREDHARRSASTDAAAPTCENIAIYYAASARCADRDAQREGAPAGHRPAARPGGGRRREETDRRRRNQADRETRSRPPAVAGLERRPASRSQGAGNRQPSGPRRVPADDAGPRWGNLPILNEWKRLFPDRDPVEVHQQVWQVELVCPGGGKYVWNEK